MMQCPNCGSKEISVLNKPTEGREIVCDNCGHAGSASDFIAEGDKVNSVEGAVRYVESSFFDAADRTSALVISIHEIGEHSVANIWLVSQGVYLKILPERIEPKGDAVAISIGEVNRLSQNEHYARLMADDVRWAMVVTSLMLLACR